MCGLTVAQLEIIVLFCPILPRIGGQFARRCQLFAIVAELIISSPLFALRPIATVDNPFALRWVVVGTVLYGGCASIASLTEVSYLIYRIQKHHRSKEKRNGIHSDQMKWFSISYCVILLFDFLGLFMLLQTGRLQILALIPSLTLNVRVVLISYIFFRLRKMAMFKQMEKNSRIGKNIEGQNEAALNDKFSNTQRISGNNK
jgi:hypothetical protein